ncbi:16S rRNA (guanine(527)-N(7))-methyltransferase RsmG [Sebaldella sp. S0638]|uniref:16S rRNA (guanine(527)-N(7))-methyltransferase RsmG n=1 Tax=Sebaldella sp. S0638 TaxID=2957809 RepID=UPI0020A19E86|nr:16S rRNA (guanine(527)-N(7))-methyltransferase RsmG [Sebaldella sp. S0638]MCP1224079.1 16S rRNA (guanine(527)-N(7))-methyltransferase RsmG [Sebaldella sp. S0638]
MKDYFKQLLEKSNIKLEDSKIDILLEYLRLLTEKNKVMNLTAIREEKEILEKHFIDSLLLSELFLHTDKKIIDIGTGAGFPGLVLAVVFPEKDFLLVDSVRKKVAFIDETAEILGLTNVKTSYERAEDLIKNSRSSFDVGLCRGVANLRIILEYMIPFLKTDGRFLPQKLNENEISESGNALKVLNSKILKIHRFRLPESDDERIIIEIQKLKETDSQYPRKTGIPAKKPL